MTELDIGCGCYIYNSFSFNNCLDSLHVDGILKLGINVQDMHSSLVVSFVLLVLILKKYLKFLDFNKLIKEESQEKNKKGMTILL